MKIIDLLFGKKYYIDITECDYYKLSPTEIMIEDMCGKQTSTYNIDIISNDVSHSYIVCRISDNIINSMSNLKVKFQQYGENGPVKMVFRTKDKSFATKLKLKMG